MSRYRNKGLCMSLAVVLNGAPVGQALQASYNGHHADVQTKAVQRHIPRGALQRWDVRGNTLTVTTDQFFGAGFEASP